LPNRRRAPRTKSKSRRRLSPKKPGRTRFKHKRFTFSRLGQVRAKIWELRAARGIPFDEAIADQVARKFVDKHEAKIREIGSKAKKIVVEKGTAPGKYARGAFIFAHIVGGKSTEKYMGFVREEFTDLFWLSKKWALMFKTGDIRTNQKGFKVQYQSRKTGSKFLFRGMQIEIITKKVGKRIVYGAKTAKKKTRKKTKTVRRRRY
jgi:hypothetical protein